MELLTELYSEEIPARLQKLTEQNFKQILQKNLSANKLSFNALEVHCGPRRICFYVDGLPDYVTIEAQSIKGPATSSPRQAVEGFCRSHHINIADLTVETHKEQTFYFYNMPQNRLKTAEILLEVLTKTIDSYVWPKAMYWYEGSNAIAWTRPLRNILCILDDNILPFRYGDLQANNFTYGHHLRNYQKIKVDNFANYQAKLRQSLVILSTEERLDMIKKALLNETKDLDVTYQEDENLLEEAAGLVEYPEIMIGSIDKKFMTLPAEIITTSMRNHQKYFSVLDTQGKLAPFFAFVSNAKANFTILQGNEKVLRARLADALYFYNKDKATPLQLQTTKLDAMQFHQKLGSVGDKVKRLTQLCEYFGKHYLIVDQKALITAAALCKSDLVSEIVGEFPELQGIMGSIYAKNEGYAEIIASIIKDHYKPLGPKDTTPLGAGAWLSLADKLDSLVGLMLAGERASSKGDAYALRRLALGIIRIILSLERAELEIKQLIEQVIKIYQAKITLDYKQLAEVSLEIWQFIEERAKFYFKDLYGANIVNAVLDLNKEENLHIINCNLAIFANFAASTQGQAVLALYKRIHNILKSNITDKLAGVIDFGKQTKYEKNVYQALTDLKNQLQDGDKLSTKITELLKLEQPVTELFEHVLIIDAEPLLAKNRLLLLQDIKDAMLSIAKFDLFYE